jgi:signal transduction histidine kinase
MKADLHKRYQNKVEDFQESYKQSCEAKLKSSREFEDKKEQRGDSASKNAKKALDEISSLRNEIQKLTSSLSVSQNTNEKQERQIEL